MKMQPLRKIRSLRWLFTAGFLYALLIGGCKKPESETSEPVKSAPVVEKIDPNAIKIGFFAPLSGAQASFGNEALRGSKLAVEEINAAGGILKRKFHLVVKDTQSRTGETEHVVQELVTQDKVDALLGEPTTAGSLEAAPIAQLAGIPMISPSSTNEKVTAVGDCIFRACFVDAFQGRVMAKFARSIDVKRAAILSNKGSEYSVGLAESFKQDFVANGGEIVAEQSYKSGDKDFGSQLISIKQQNPDVIFLPSYYAEVPLIVQQARKLGLEMPFLGTDGWDSPDLLLSAGPSANNCYFSTHFSHEDKTPKVQEFTTSYTALYGTPPPALAALAYDSVYLLAEALTRAEVVEPLKLKETLAATSNFPGVTGSITYNEFRNPSKSAVVLRIQDGQTEYLETVTP